MAVFERKLVAYKARWVDQITTEDLSILKVI